MDKVNGVDFSGCLDLGENGDAAVGAFYKVLAGTNAFGTLSTNIYLDFSYTQVPLELVTKWTKICGEDNRVLLLNVANNETITDELITALNFQKIAGLNLANTPITDAGLAKIIQSIQLNGIGPFRYLNLTGSKVTAAGIEALMNAVRAAGQLETPFTLYWNNDTVFRAGGEANEAVTLTSQATAVPAVPSEVAPTPAASLLSLPGIGIGPAEAPTSGVPLSTPSVGSTGSPGETIPPVVPTIPGLTASEEKAALAALSSLDSAPSPAPSSGSTGASLPGALKFLAPVAEALKSPAQSDDAMIQALMSR
ncbi:MAG: hypothetical protein LBI20_01495 [Holosporales bacterium]|nr:hypothetical protein [Holosporales bacterium]